MFYDAVGFYRDLPQVQFAKGFIEGGSTMTEWDHDQHKRSVWGELGGGLSDMMAIGGASEELMAFSKSLKTAQVVRSAFSAETSTTGYRLVSSEAPYLKDLLETGHIPANIKGTYFSLDNLEDALGSFRAQIPKNGNIMVEFDTAQLGIDVRVPLGKYGAGPHLEPIARDFPEYGFGGASQRTTTSQINATRIIDRRTGAILYERKN